MKSRYAGPNGTCQPNGKISLSDEEAAALVEGGYAEYLNEPAAVEETKQVESGTPTLDEFKKLNADPQKDLLTVLEIEGDANNLENRMALYAAYLENLEK